MAWHYLALICTLLQLSRAATIEGQLVFTEQMKRMNERDMNFIMHDVMVHLEGAPGTSQWTQVFPTGKFVFYNAPESNSYIISAGGANIRFVPIRVDVNGKGALRSREMNRIDPHLVSKLPYPVQLKVMGKPQFFHIRQKIDIIGMVMGNPMILLMGVSFLLMMIMPKVADMDDPEMKKQMEESMSWMKPKNNQQAGMPDMAETLNNWFGPPKPVTKTKKKK